MIKKTYNGVEDNYKYYNIIILNHKHNHEQM